MKISFLLIMLTMLNAYATNIFSQNARVSVDMQNATVREVVSEIERQGGINFLFNDNLAGLNQRVNISFTDHPIKNVLMSALSQADMTYEEIKDDFVVLLSKPVDLKQQQIAVTGLVTDADTGEPLPGVSILIEGTNTGTVTNADGEYSISVPEQNRVLVFSYIGYAVQRLPVEDQNVINVDLTPELAALDEIVIIGYASQRIGEITGSVSTITSEQLADIPAADASSTLRGVTSGVTITQNNRPGSGAIVRIRGLGTINNNDPLWVVDGVPGATVLPEDIESISVLKDAASQAIYGARAANGVILVTTKSGARNQDIRVNFTARNGINQNISSYDLLNTQEYGEWLWLASANQGWDDYNHVQYGSGPSPTIPDYIVPARGVEGEVDHSLYDNLMMHENGTDTYLITKANKEGTDWMDAVTRNARFQQYSLGISGGGERTNYAFTANYRDEEGILDYTGFSRYGMRLNFDANLLDWLEVGERLNVTFTEFQGTRSNMGQHSVMGYIHRMQPIIPVFDIAGNHAGTIAPGTDNSPSPAFHLWSARNNYNRILFSTGNIYANATIFDGMVFRTLVGFDTDISNYRNVSYNEVAQSERGMYDGLSEGGAARIQYTWTNTLSYTANLFENHNLTAILGYEYTNAEWRNMGASRNDFFFKNDNYIQLNVGERDLNNSGSKSEWALISQFGRLNYAIANKYLFQATARRDGSSRFGEENRYGIFPAFSGGWRVSSERFMDFSNDWLDDMKIRFGWGQSGNDQIGNYNGYTTFISNPRNSYYPITGSVSSATSGFRAASIGDPRTHWETTTTTNLGLDANLLGRFNFTFDLWKRETENMLYPKRIPDILGQASAPSINIGDMVNTGFDLELTYFGNNSGIFQYDLGLNVSRYTNEIVKLSDVAGEFLSSTGTRAESGRSFPEFYGYIVEGIFQSQEEADAHATAFGSGGTYNAPGNFKYKDLNDDGVINADDQTYIGSPHPDFTAGLNINLRYRDFRLTSFLYLSYGNDMINWTRRHLDYNIWYGNRSKRALYESWGSPYLENNEDAKMPRALIEDSGHRQMSTYFLEDASFLRMQNIVIGYNVGSLFPSIPFTRMEIYGQITNVFTITNYSGLDPEIARSGMGMGVDDSAWPQPRQFMIGLGLDF